MVLKKKKNTMYRWLGKLLWTMFLCCLVAPLWAGGAQEGSRQETETVTIKFWNGFTATDGDVLREIFDRFNEENDMGIIVEMDIMPWANLLEKLPPAMATGTAPTLVLLGSEYIPEYSASGGIIKMDDFWKWSGLDRENYSENVRDAFVYKGSVYGIPMQYNTQYLYWNKDLFREAGLDPEKPPKDFNELREFAAKISDPSKEQYGFGIASTGNQCHVNITNFLWSNGGDWLNGSQTEAVCDSPEMREVLTMLQAFAQNGDTPVGMTGADLDNLLMAGKLGMYIQGPWLINGCKNNGLNFGIGAVPAGKDGKLQVPGGGVAFMITSSADDRQKAAAFECIKYWLSSEIMKEWSLRNGFPAFSREIFDDPEIQNDPILKVLSPLSAQGRLPFKGMPEYSRIASDYLDPLFEQLMYDQISPADCAACMEDGINTVLGN